MAAWVVRPTHRLLCARVLTTHDGRTIRYPDPDVKVNDVVKVDLSTGKMTSFVKFQPGSMVMLTRGRALDC